GGGGAGVVDVVDGDRGVAERAQYGLADHGHLPGGHRGHRVGHEGRLHFSGLHPGVGQGRGDGLAGQLAQRPILEPPERREADADDGRRAHRAVPLAYRLTKASTPVRKLPRLIVSQCSAPSRGMAALSGSSPNPKTACLAEVTPIRPALLATETANSSAADPACPAGYSRSTSPISNARAGLIGLAVKMNSSARLGPSRRARNCAPPPPEGRQPNRSISGTPSRSPSLSAQNR